MTRVVNIHRSRYDVYIGRAGHGKDGYFGNPIRAYEVCCECGAIHHNRRQTIPCFERYMLRRIDNDPEYRKRLRDLRGKTLGCFCAPGPCHGYVIVHWLEKDGTR